MTLLFLEPMAYQYQEKERIHQCFETGEDAAEHTSNTNLKIMMVKIVTSLVLMTLM